MPVAEMVGALRSGEVARLTKIPGIGKKTAERMVLELRDKLEEFAAAPARPSAPSATGAEEDVISALVNLGYQRAAAEKALATIGPEHAKSFEVLFRQAMAALTR